MEHAAEIVCIKRQYVSVRSAFGTDELKAGRVKPGIQLALIRFEPGARSDQRRRQKSADQRCSSKGSDLS